MTLNPPEAVRKILYVITGVGGPVVAYLLAKEIIGTLEVALWSADVQRSVRKEQPVGDGWSPPLEVDSLRSFSSTLAERLGPHRLRRFCLSAKTNIPRDRA